MKRIAVAVWRGAWIGAIAGSGVAIVLLSLDEIRPFSPDTNAFVEKLAFRFCPLYILGFSNLVSSYGALAALTIAGNVVLYGVAFAVISAMYAIFRRLSS